MRNDKNLLNVLPNTCKPKDLISIFEENIEVLKEYNGYFPILLKTFKEKGILESKDGLGFLIFSAEGSLINTELSLVNPQDVAFQISQALRAQSEGAGIDPGIDSGNDGALELSRAQKMVLVSTNGNLYPAYDWRDETVKESDAKIVVSWIVEGRQKIKDAETKPKGGWGGWA